MEKDAADLRINFENWNRLVSGYTVPEYHGSTCLTEGEQLSLIMPLSEQIVVSNELFLEGIHFDLSYTPFRSLGYKLSTLALAKIYAKNAIPTQIQCAFALPDKIGLRSMDAFWQGLADTAKKHAVDLVDGGSLGLSRGAMAVSIQVLGAVDNDRWTGLDGFQPGQVLCVTGNLGAPYLALLLLEREKHIQQEHPNIKPNFENQRELLQGFFQPYLPVETLNSLHAQAIKPLGMTHLLDGLAGAIFRISHRNQVGVLIYEDKIPIAESVRQFAHSLPIDPTLCVLNGGEETAMLLSLSPETYLKIAEQEIVYPIGIIKDAENGRKIQTKMGNIHELKAQGWSM